jgi:2,4-dienoyl-CoA reductase-like NADH-dependent reductase (Old Yellow Enzyme family)
MFADLFSPLTLPNGVVIPNRVAKAAMAEGLAGPGQRPGRKLVRLYRAWAEGGAGLLITGNVMIDPHALSEPGDVVLSKNSDLAPFRAWAEAARSQGAQAWMQINHPGRQVMASLGQPGWGPSEVALELGRYSKLAARPLAMTEAEIMRTIERFAETAAQAEAAGFTGVEIHAAHGYLINQFLSPRTNLRTDRWNGGPFQRAGLLIMIVNAVRSVVSDGFCVAVKLNAADFQHGGFDGADAATVIRMLNDCAVDMVELSGGTYEVPAMRGITGDGRILAREAYFQGFAREMIGIAHMPIMLTGGIHRRAVAEQVMAQGVAMIGMATALAMNPGLPRMWREGRADDGLRPAAAFKDRITASLANLAVVKRQLHRLGSGDRPKSRLNPLFSLILDRWHARRLARRYRRWLGATSGGTRARPEQFQGMQVIRVAMAIGAALTANGALAASNPSSRGEIKRLDFPKQPPCLRAASHRTPLRLVAAVPVGGRGAIRYRLPGPGRSSPLFGVPYRVGESAAWALSGVQAGRGQSAR